MRSTGSKRRRRITKAICPLPKRSAFEGQLAYFFVRQFGDCLETRLVEVVGKVGEDTQELVEFAARMKFINGLVLIVVMAFRKA